LKRSKHYKHNAKEDVEDFHDANYWHKYHDFPPNLNALLKNADNFDYRGSA
jgi:hypothetical protein